MDIVPTSAPEAKSKPRKQARSRPLCEAGGEAGRGLWEFRLAGDGGEIEVGSETVEIFTETKSRRDRLQGKGLRCNQALEL